MRLVLDEHYSPLVAERLRGRGHDALAVRDVSGLLESSDAELLAWAEQEHRVLVTEDVQDFTALHREAVSRGKRLPGIVFTSPRKFPRQMASLGLLVDALADLLASRREEDEIPGGIAWL